MTAIVAFIAIFSTAAFMVLWFWVARRELRILQKAVEAASCQLTASRQQAHCVRDGPDAARAQEILTRSQRVYLQAASLYNSALKKPWNAVPALFLGFHPAKEGGTQ